MERTLLLSVEDWQNWYQSRVSMWDSSRRVRSWGDSETPTEYPCLVIECDNEDEGWGFTCYDFIYRKDVDQIFQPVISPTRIA